MKHLLAVEYLAREDIERIMERAEKLRGDRAAGHQEGPDAARPHDRQSVLRVEHAHQLLVRARVEAPVGRRRLGEVGGLIGRQGRVAQGHRRDAERVRAGGDRDPPLHAGAAELITRWTDAAVINAGDGKHEHPSQALLDVYTPRGRIGSLEGRKIWIVGDVMHSRVARSNALAFSAMGAEVTVCGPPTLIPADRGARLPCRLPSTSSARPMSCTRSECSGSAWASFVPSIRESAALYQIDARRLSPRQLLMHPGPVNRGRWRRT